MELPKESPPTTAIAFNSNFSNDNAQHNVNAQNNLSSINGLSDVDQTDLIQIVKILQKYNFKVKKHICKITAILVLKCE